MKHKNTYQIALDANSRTLARQHKVKQEQLQKQQPKKKQKPLPEWNSTINDENKYKLSQVEQLQKKASMVSRNHQIAAEEWQIKQQKLKFNIIDDDTQQVYQTALESKKLGKPRFDVERKNLSQMIQENYSCNYKSVPIKKTQVEVAEEQLKNTRKLINQLETNKENNPQKVIQITKKNLKQAQNNFQQIQGIDETLEYMEKTLKMNNKAVDVVDKEEVECFSQLSEEEEENIQDQINNLEYDETQVDSSNQEEQQDEQEEQEESEDLSEQQKQYQEYYQSQMESQQQSYQQLQPQQYEDYEEEYSIQSQQNQQKEIYDQNIYQQQEQSEKSYDLDDSEDLESLCSMLQNTRNELENIDVSSQIQQNNWDDIQIPKKQTKGMIQGRKIINDQQYLDLHDDNLPQKQQLQDQFYPYFQQ